MKYLLPLYIRLIDYQIKYIPKKLSPILQKSRDQPRSLRQTSLLVLYRTLPILRTKPINYQIAQIKTSLPGYQYSTRIIVIQFQRLNLISYYLNDYMITRSSQKEELQLLTSSSTYYTGYQQKNSRQSRSTQQRTWIKASLSLVRYLLQLQYSLSKSQIVLSISVLTIRS